MRWATASYKAIHEILTNPVFAGAYAYGRKRVERRVIDGQVRERVRRTPREEWHVCIEGHHPGYITFERYLANQQRLRSNWRPPRGEGGGAAREGRALLQGLIRCGRCGRRMQVGYSGKTLVPNYSCVCGNQLYGTERCQSVGGRRIERVVLDAVFQALQPAGIEATLRAIEHANGDHQARVRSAELELERAQIHADRAQRQFDACEPENRLVARTLEREWEQRFTDVRSAERAVAEVAAKRPDPLTERRDRLVPRSRRRPAQGVRRAHHHRPRAQAAAARDPHRRRRDRRPRRRATRRSAAGRVGGRPGHRAHRGAATDRQPHALHRPGHDRARSPARRALPRQADRRDPRPPATATGAGNQFTAHRVAGLRAHHGIPACPVRPTSDDGEVVTIAKAASELDVSTATVHRWLREGFIVGEQITPGAPWQIRHHRRAPTSASARTHPTDGCRSPKPHRRSASRARPCCTRSNAANLPPSTSTAASEKAYESRSNPTRLDCSRTTSERTRSAKPTPRA